MHQLLHQTVLETNYFRQLADSCSFIFLISASRLKATAAAQWPRKALTKLAFFYFGKKEKNFIWLSTAPPAARLRQEGLAMFQRLLLNLERAAGQSADPEELFLRSGSIRT